MVPAVAAGVRIDDAALAALAGDLAPVALPSREDVASLAARWRVRAGAQAPARATRGRGFYVQLSPGTLAVARRGHDEGADSTRLDGCDEDGRPLQGALWGDVEEDAGGPARVITSWSGPSRARMLRVVAELDYSAWESDGGSLALVTRTLPDHWELYAPNARAWQRLGLRFRKRYVRATGRRWRTIWKREFQDRGAPHGHDLMRVPARVGPDTLGYPVDMGYAPAADELGYDAALGYAPAAWMRFEDWARQAWAEVCASSLSKADRRAEFDAGHYGRHLARGVDFSWSGIKYRDPRRIGIYFLKHAAKSSGSKEYQNQAPTSWVDAGDVGRFWGTAGLDTARVEVEVDEETWNQVRRVLRHLARADAWRIDSQRARHGTGVCEHRCVCTRDGPKRRRRRSLVWSGGWVLLGDALRVAVQLLDRL